MEIIDLPGNLGKKLQASEDSVTEEDWTGLKVPRFGSDGTRFERCIFERMRVKQVRFGGGGKHAEFVDCSFGNSQLAFGPGGRAKFINCTFRNTRLTDFTINPVSIVNCDFSGAVLTRCQLWGAPTKHDRSENPYLNPVNEVHGNDFSTTTFDDTNFRGGVDLTKQKFPIDENHALALDGSTALARATALVNSWTPEREKDREEALSWIGIRQGGIDRGQKQLFVTWPKKWISREAWIGLRQAINES